MIAVEGLLWRLSTLPRQPYDLRHIACFRPSGFSGLLCILLRGNRNPTVTTASWAWSGAQLQKRRIGRIISIWEFPKITGLNVDLEWQGSYYKDTHRRTLPRYRKSQKVNTAFSALDWSQHFARPPAQPYSSGDRGMGAQGYASAPFKTCFSTLSPQDV